MEPRHGGLPRSHSERGHHIFWRSESVEGNKKVAQRPKRLEEIDPLHPEDKIKTLVETRGLGGWIVAAPSHGRVHEYRQRLPAGKRRR